MPAKTRICDNPHPSTGTETPKTGKQIFELPTRNRTLHGGSNLCIVGAPMLADLRTVARHAGLAGTERGIGGRDQSHVGRQRIERHRLLSTSPTVVDSPSLGVTRRIAICVGEHFASVRRLTTASAWEIESRNESLDDAVERCEATGTGSSIRWRCATCCDVGPPPATRRLGDRSRRAAAARSMDRCTRDAASRRSQPNSLITSRSMCRFHMRSGRLLRQRNCKGPPMSAGVNPAGEAY